jgi:hypothetical protein
MTAPHVSRILSFVSHFPGKSCEFRVTRSESKPKRGTRNPKLPRKICFTFHASREQHDYRRA